MLVSVPSNPLEMKYRREIDLTSSSRGGRRWNSRVASGHLSCGVSTCSTRRSPQTTWIDRVHRSAEVGDGLLERVGVDLVAFDRQLEVLDLAIGLDQNDVDGPTPGLSATVSANSRISGSCGFMTSRTSRLIAAVIRRTVVLDALSVEGRLYRSIRRMSVATAT